MGYFFFNDTATTEIYTLSLHDALPISPGDVGHPGHALVVEIHVDSLGHGRNLSSSRHRLPWPEPGSGVAVDTPVRAAVTRSEEHTSELQSRQYLVCRLLLEKKNNTACR